MSSTEDLWNTFQRLWGAFTPTLPNTKAQLFREVNSSWPQDAFMENRTPAFKYTTRTAILNPNPLVGGFFLPARPLGDPGRALWFFWSQNVFTLVNQMQVLVPGKWPAPFLKSAGGGSVLQAGPPTPNKAWWDTVIVHPSTTAVFIGLSNYPLVVWWLWFPVTVWWLSHVRINIWSLPLHFKQFSHIITCLNCRTRGLISENHGIHYASSLKSAPFLP